MMGSLLDSISTLLDNMFADMVLLMKLRMVFQRMSNAPSSSVTAGAEVISEIPRLLA